MSESSESKPSAFNRLKAASQSAAERRSNTFKGVTIEADRVLWKKGSVPLAGCSARVETAGEISQRSTLTRFVVTGGLGAIAFKKKKDNRELYLTIEGVGDATVIELDPKKDGSDARAFAARLNSKAALAAQQ